MFGSIKFLRTYQQAVTNENVTPIEVHMYKIGGSRSFDSALKRKRQGLWGSAARNRMIAAVVGKPEYKDKQVLIVVDTVEHLFYLHKLLPDFALAYGSIATKHYKKMKKLGLMSEDFVAATPDELIELREKFENREVLKAIATGVWNTGVDFPSLDICVRAGGGSSDIKSIQTPGRVSRKSDGKDIGILIDFFDDIDDTMKKSSKKRMKSYKEYGWKIIKHYSG